MTRSRKDSHPELSAEYAWNVFLCHSSRDKERVRWLASELKKHDVGVWLDESEIKLGDSVTLKIDDGLRRSRWLIITLSEYLASRMAEYDQTCWPREEYGAVMYNAISR